MTATLLDRLTEYEQIILLKEFNMLPRNKANQIQKGYVELLARKWNMKKQVFRNVLKRIQDKFE